MFDKYRYNGLFHVVIYGTGLYSTKINPGRKGWKIENKGFKIQKSDVLNISHIYTKDCNGTKNIYLLI